MVFNLLNRLFAEHNTQFQQEKSLFSELSTRAADELAILRFVIRRFYLSFSRALFIIANFSE